MELRVDVRVFLSAVPFVNLHRLCVTRVVAYFKADLGGLKGTELPIVVFGVVDCALVWLANV